MTNGVLNEWENIPSIWVQIFIKMQNIMKIRKVYRFIIKSQFMTISFFSMVSFLEAWTKMIVPHQWWYNTDRCNFIKLLMGSVAERLGTSLICRRP